MMDMRTATAVGLAAILLATGGTAQADITIEVVSVGDPDNPADNTGYGAVDHTYDIGTYEVTAGQYTVFLNAVATTADTYGLYSTWMSYGENGKGCRITRGGYSGNYTYSVADDWADRPVNYVSWGDAARFANWMHNGQPTGGQNLNTTEDGAYYLNGATTDAALQAVSRQADWQWAIPTENEWYKAAYYNPATSSYYDYETSSNAMPSNDLIDPDPGNNATYYDGAYTIGPSYYRTEFGEHENSESPYGTFDQGGNVSEWNELILYTSFRGVRGGSFNDTSLGAGNRCINNPSSEELYTGFRLVEVPEPASLALLALGGAGMLLRRRRRGG